MPCNDFHTISSDDVAIIDEIQMIENSQRGGAWTRALLGIPAREIHLCGHECAIELVDRLASSMGESLEVLNASLCVCVWVGVSVGVVCICISVHNIKISCLNVMFVHWYHPFVHIIT